MHTTRAPLNLSILQSVSAAHVQPLRSIRIPASKNPKGFLTVQETGIYEDSRIPTAPSYT